MKKSFNLNPLHNIIIGVLFSVSLFSCESDELQQSDAIDGVPTHSHSISVSNGMFVFPDEDSFSKTLSAVNSLDKSEYRKFIVSYGISTAKSIFEDVVDAEWIISDHYEALAKKGQSIPSTPVLSQEYITALDNQVIRVVEGDDGGYFDYNMYEVSMAPLVNSKNLVQIGRKIYRFGLERKEIIENGDLSLISRLN